MKYHPFRAFQRNKVGCMATVTLLAIGSFIFLPVLLDLLGGGGRGGAGGQISTIAESRRFGAITDLELERLRNHQEGLWRFLAVLLRNLATVDPSDEERMRALTPLEMYIGQIAQSQTAEGLINIWLVSQYVQEEGLSADWNDVSNLLQELTGGYISDAVFDASLQATGMSRRTVEQLLVRQILWQQALSRFELSISAVTPATRWDWFQRLYRQVTIEAAAVPIEALIGQVPEPSERQLNTLFEQRRGSRYNPLVADSGFIMPTELAFQYVIAEPTPQLLESITEEEMLEFYEENKAELFRRPVTPISEIPGVMPGMPGGAFPAFPTPGRPATPLLPELPDIGDLLPESMPTDILEETVAEEPIPAEPAQEESAPEESAPAEPVPAEPASSEEAADESEASAEEETSAMPTVLTRLVSYQMEEAEQVGEAATETISEPQEEQATEPATEGAEESASQEEVTEQMPADIEAVRVEAVQEGSAPVDLSILYLPFDEVKDDIRARLAWDKAMEALPIIQAQMQEYARTYNEHFEQGRPIPPMPDLTDFVAEQGLELVTVPMGNIFAALQTEFARGTHERQHLIQKFRRMPMMFEGEVFWGSRGPVLYWVTGEKQELRPERLEQVRDVVLQRWKEAEARTLAMKKAEELANEARASGRSLAEVFASRSGVAVVDTESFTWMTYGGIAPSTAVIRRVPPVLGEVRERGVVVGNSEFDNELIVAPGWDFMETVYSLQVGEIGVVFNQPQSAAYVVRVTSSSPSADVLWEQFQSTFVLIYLAAGRSEMMATSFEAWLDEIREKTGFRWVNRPDSHGLGWDDREF